MEQNHKENISLDRATTHILEECRMVLPGIQALFGFQLIAVFNPGFSEHLSTSEQHLHLLSVGAEAHCRRYVIRRQYWKDRSSGRIVQ